MTRWMAWIVCAALGLGFVACGDDDDSDGGAAGGTGGSAGSTGGTGGGTAGSTAGSGGGATALDCDVYCKKVDELCAPAAEPFYDDCKGGCDAEGPSYDAQAQGALMACLGSATTCKQLTDCSLGQTNPNAPAGDTQFCDTLCTAQATLCPESINYYTCIYGCFAELPIDEPTKTAVSACAQETSCEALQTCLNEI